MSQLYLPAAHTDADLMLAGQIAERIDSAKLYVAWTSEHGSACPEIFAELRDPAPLWYEACAIVVQVVRRLWSALLRREAPRRISGPVSGPEAEPEPAAA